MGTTNLEPLTYRAVRGDFILGMEESRDRSWISAFTSIFDTDQPQEDYPFLGAVPRLRKWEGSRHVSEMNRGKITIVNDDWEASIKVARKDWRRDKTAQISMRVRELGESATELPEELLSSIVINGGTGLAWDGTALFSTSRTWGKSGTINNALGTGDGLAGGATPTSAQQQANIMKCIQQMLGFKDDAGRPMNGQAREFGVMVPVNMWTATIAALQDMFTSAGVSNTLRSALESGAIVVRPYVNPRLTSTTQFFVARTDARIKPLIYQEELVNLELLGPDSEFARLNNQVLVGGHIAGGAAPGRPELIVRGATA
ncbi:MAG: hypothetical protein EKK55_07750 [Rhodocyclaceae bacterium]|nr:MAG: hypothetical protein EKK55_07750 [Rhodocyclaceae bacterium]